MHPGAPYKVRWMGVLPTSARARTTTLGRSRVLDLGALSNSEARSRSNLHPKAIEQPASHSGWRDFLRYTRTVKRHLALRWTVLVALAFAASAAFGQDNSSVERYAEEGQAALAAGRYEGAERAFGQLRQLQPGRAGGHAKRGPSHLQ